MNFNWTKMAWINWILMRRMASHRVHTVHLVVLNRILKYIANVVNGKHLFRMSGDRKAG